METSLIIFLSRNRDTEYVSYFKLKTEAQLRYKMLHLLTKKWSNGKYPPYVSLNGGCDYSNIHVLTLNIGRTCSRCLADVKGAWTWLTDSMRFLAAVEITSISMFHKKRRRFSLEITVEENSRYSLTEITKTKQITCWWISLLFHTIGWI
jgi:hypothetical protein